MPSKSKPAGPRTNETCRLANHEFERQTLEAQLRSNGYPQVIVAAVIEIDVVSGFQANTNWSGERFDSAAGIEGKIGPAGVQTHRAGEAGWGVLIADAEVVKSHFAGHEYAEGSRAGWNLGPKKPCRVRNRVVTVWSITPLENS